MSSNSLKAYAVFWIFCDFCGNCQIICGILKLIYLKGFRPSLYKLQSSKRGSALKLEAYGMGFR